MEQRDRTDIAVPLVRRNFVLNVINGALSAVAIRVADPGTVVPLLVLRLARAEWAVGLAAAVQESGRVITQVFAARLLDAVERKRPVYIWASVARVTVLAATSVALLGGVGHDPRVVLGIVLLGLFLLMFGNGVAELAWSDVTARSVPSRRRGSLLTGRMFCGLVLSALIAGPLVNHYLSAEAGHEFPANYGMLFVAKTGFFAAAWLIFSFMREPRPHAARRVLTMRQHLTRGLRILRRDESYRGLLHLRLMTGVYWAVPTFFIAFATTTLGLPERWAALFLTLRILSEIVGSLVFGRVSDRLGNRKVIVLSCWVALGTFGFATLAALHASPVAAVPGLSATLLGAAFVGLGLLTPARVMGEINYMLDIAPAPKRTSYIGFGNAFMLPLSVLPVLVGYLAPTTGYLPIFAAAGLVAAGSVLPAVRLQEPRDTLLVEPEGAD